MADRQIVNTNGIQYSFDAPEDYKSQPVSTQFLYTVYDITARNVLEKNKVVYCSGYYDFYRLLNIWNQQTLNSPFPRFMYIGV